MFDFYITKLFSHDKQILLNDSLRSSLRHGPYFLWLQLKQRKNQQS